MNPELKQRWIDALRSGEYEQAQRTLRKDEEFCCLGVLCDIVNKGEWTPATDSRKWTYTYGDDFSSQTLPYEMADDLVGKAVSENVCVELPFSIHLQGGIIKQGEEVALSKLNDGGIDFETIARVIEETSSL